MQYLGYTKKNQIIFFFSEIQIYQGNPAFWQLERGWVYGQRPSWLFDLSPLFSHSELQFLQLPLLQTQGPRGL